MYVYVTDSAFTVKQYDPLRVQALFLFVSSLRNLYLLKKMIVITRLSPQPISSILADAVASTLHLTAPPSR